MTMRTVSPAWRDALPKVACVALCVALVGCASAPQERRWLSLPLDAPPSAAAPTSAPASSVAAASAARATPQIRLQRVQIPEYLQSNRVRFRDSAATLAEWPGVRWAERPEIGLTRHLGLQLAELGQAGWICADPLPTDAASFKARVEEGRTRLNLIAQEVARLAGTVLVEYAAAIRKLKDAKPPKDVADDITGQLQRLMPKRFIVQTPYTQLQHFPRYLKAITLRLDKLKGDPARDAQRLTELRPLDQRYTRRLAELKGVLDARTDEFRWLLEELRVSLFAQELRTPQPVSIKRLEKAWA